MNAEFKKTLVHQATQMSKELTTFESNQLPGDDTIKFGVSLWEMDWVKEDLMKLMMNFEGNSYVHPDDNMMILLVKKVIYHSRKISSSFHIVARQMFEAYVEEMGMQLFVWLKQVWFKLEKYDRVNYEKTLRVYLNTIMWTPAGRLDYERMIFTLLEENRFPSEFTKFFELSAFSFEEKIKEFYAKAKKAVIDFIHKLIEERCRDFDNEKANKVEYEYDYYLQAYWFHRLSHNVNTVSVDDLIGEYGRTFDHSVDENQIGEGNFFSLSAYYSHHYSLRYFWNRMSENEKNIFFNESLIHALSHKLVWDFYGAKTEVFKFFFNNMNVDRYTKFLTSLYNGEFPLIMIAIVLSMPRREFYFPTFDILKHYIPNKNNPLIDQDSVFNTLISYMNRNEEATSQGVVMRTVVLEILKVAEYRF